MLIVIASLLGVPLWLILGVVGLKLWQRHRFKQQPGVFEAKLRLESGASDDFGAKWPRLSGYAMWVHDVLLVHQGAGLRSTIPVPVQAVEGPLDVADLAEAKRLGDQPSLYRLMLDNGAVLEMGVPSEAQSLAAGPFAQPVLAGRRDMVPRPIQGLV